MSLTRDSNSVLRGIDPVVFFPMEEDAGAVSPTQPIPIQLDDLEALLGPQVGEEWQTELWESLAQLGDQMAEVVADRCQFFAGLENIAPHLGPSIALLAAERQQLVDEIETLCNDLRSVGGGYVLKRARQVSDKLRQTLEAEEDILGEAFWHDLGTAG